MSILAIDPGPEYSAFVGLETETLEITRSGKVPNAELLSGLEVHSRDGDFERVVIEMVACYGMPVGKSVFDTCIWEGRFMQAWGHDDRLTGIYRREVKLHLCNSVRAKDSNVRQALIDKFGGKTKAIGRKATPGPLYGIKADMWAALGVAVTYAETAAC